MVNKKTRFMITKEIYILNLLDLKYCGFQIWMFLRILPALAIRFLMKYTKIKMFDVLIEMLRRILPPPAPPAIAGGEVFPPALQGGIKGGLNYNHNMQQNGHLRLDKIL